MCWCLGLRITNYLTVSTYAILLGDYGLGLRSRWSVRRCSCNREWKRSGSKWVQVGCEHKGSGEQKGSGELAQCPKAKNSRGKKRRASPDSVGFSVGWYRVQRPGCKEGESTTQREQHVLASIWQPTGAPQWFRTLWRTKGGPEDGKANMNVKIRMQIRRAGFGPRNSFLLSW